LHNPANKQTNKLTHKQTNADENTTSAGRGNNIRRLTAAIPGQRISRYTRMADYSG